MGALIAEPVGATDQFSPVAAAPMIIRSRIHAPVRMAKQS